MTMTLPAAPSAFPPPSTAWEEIVDPGEEALVREFLETIQAQQRAVASKDGAPLRRGFHAKLHLGAQAQFRVLPRLPEHARQGVFSEARTYDAVVRFSNGHFSIQPDATKDPRGIAIKLFGVQGPTLHPGNADASTQDFLATSHSVTSTVRDIGQFVAFVQSAAHGSKLRLALGLARRLGVREALRIIKAVKRTVLDPDVPSMATEHYAGTAPIQLGPYAAKFTVRPAEGTAPPRDRQRTPDFLREELEERLREGDLWFDFVVQLFVDEARTPIEDTSVAWDPRVAPFVKVAELRIPRVDLSTEAARETSRKVDALSFSPWHALADHRPLGGVMRARRVAYEASARLRGHAPEPAGLPL